MLHKRLVDQWDWDGALDLLCAGLLSPWILFDFGHRSANTFAVMIS